MSGKVNTARDFDALRCSQQKKQHIALMVGMWNSADAHNEIVTGANRPIGFRLEGYQTQASRRFHRRLKYAADKLGLRVR